MNKVVIEEKYISEFVNSVLCDARIKSQDLSIELFHHNISYTDTPSAIRNGILSLRELSDRGIKNLTEEQLKTFSDDSSHVNGVDDVSLSLTGVKDFYRGELEYCPYSMFYTDILINRNIVARRNNIHYGNEYLVKKCIEPKDFKAVDIRLIKLISEYEKMTVSSSKEENLSRMIKYYNALREIAQALVDTSLNIPLREMSSENITLDIEKIKNSAILELKK